MVGGGPSGVSAAVAAARLGARTLIVESNGYMGGVWTSSLVTTLAGFNALLRPYPRIVGGVPEEWHLRAAALGGARDDTGFLQNTNPEVMKRVADDLLEEAGVEILYHTWVARPIVEDGRVAGAFVENTEGRFAVLAKVTIDCTGNGDVVARSGADWEKSDQLQPMTMCFYMAYARPDPAIDHLAPSEMPVGPDPDYLDTKIATGRFDIPFDVDHMLAAFEAGELPKFGGPFTGGMSKDIVWVNATRVIADGTDIKDLTRAEIQGRRDSARLIEYFREHVPGLEDVELIQTSPYIGVRESRRLLGVVTLTGDDIRSDCRFDDAIGVGGWPIDVQGHEAGNHRMWVPEPYEIPYRVLLPGTVEGLIAAGRCISVDRAALGSTRVGGTCGVTGQAAGTAAWLAASTGVAPRDVDVAVLRGTLQDQGALISADAI